MTLPANCSWRLPVGSDSNAAGCPDWELGSLGGSCCLYHYHSSFGPGLGLKKLIPIFCSLIFCSLVHYIYWVMITLILKVINETEKHRDQLRQSTWLEKQLAPVMMVIIPQSTEKLFDTMASTVGQIWTTKYVNSRWTIWVISDNVLVFLDPQQRC